MSTELRAHAQYLLDAFIEGGYCEGREDEAHINGLHAALKEPAELTFDEVTAVNRIRCTRWHPGYPEDNDWTGSDWSNAMGGEVGELAEATLAALTLLARLTAASGNAGNTVKKLRRHDCNLVGALDPAAEELLVKLGHEMADVYLYMDLLAQFYGIDLPAAIIEKFNIVSDRQGFPDKLEVR